MLFIETNLMYRKKTCLIIIDVKIQHILEINLINNRGPNKMIFTFWMN